MILTKENIVSVDIDSMVNDKIKSGNVNRLLLLVPTNRKARNIKKEIISGSPGQAASGINIETLGTIAAKILNETKPFRQLSEAAASVFIKKCAAETKLKYFSLYKDEIPFGTLDRIKNVISEYKRQGISPAGLRFETEKLEGSEKNKAADISDIYEKYLNKTKSLNAFETGDVYNELNLLDINSFRQNFRRLYPDVELIAAIDFSEFSIPEILILDKL
jgi:ATP-dependent helicase/nuclease subunit B